MIREGLSAPSYHIIEPEVQTEDVLSKIFIHVKHVLRLGNQVYLFCLYHVFVFFRLFGFWYKMKQLKKVNKIKQYIHKCRPDDSMQTLTTHTQFTHNQTMEKKIIRDIPE